MKNQPTLRSFFKQHFPFNEEGLDELVASFEFKSFDKGDIILQPNKIEKELRFITSGFIREYYSTDLKEVNINFYGEHEFPTDIYSFYNSASTKKWQACITDVELQSLSKNKYDTLLRKFSCGNEVVHQSMQNLIKRKTDVEYNRTTKTTEELYSNLLEKKPSWLLHIPQYHIASYLNVTPETLSRIRKRIS